ncbi:alpha/beta hydrolase family protein [Stenotrophomonas maltophilia]|uniref:alpha/beta hydrolase family protein n=1 Tax=Stenotrophomonas maltophilia TaxID=40324 RepID=UPI00404111A5
MHRTLVSLAAWSAMAFSAQAVAATAASPCAAASYRMADGSTLDIGPGAGDQLRWRTPDGRSGALQRTAGDAWTSTRGWTGQPDGHRMVLKDCGKRGISVDGMKGERIPLRQIDTRFSGAGATLQGRLTLPPGDAPVPLVVLVHGAENSSALERYSLQREFASAGIAVFAYDKRGTGRSGGRYTQNYLTLANDLILATREARRLAGARAQRVGYQAGSQGGWVAPLAARIEPVDFIVISFGLAVSPLEEDREAIAFDMQRAGQGAEATAQAMQIADAVATIVESGFTEGFDVLAEVKQRYQHAPWFPAVRGNIAGYLLSTPEVTAREQGPRLLDGVPAHYDPLPVLTHLQVPQLWIFGGQDRDAPPVETLRRLAVLQGQGRPIYTAVYADADHGMYEFELDAAGERVSTRQPAGYFQLMTDFIRGDALRAEYGQARPTSAR